MSIELINDHVLIPVAPNWRERPSLSRKWMTEISETLTGAEDRGALRQLPRLTLSYMATPLSLERRAAFEAQLMAALKSGKAAAPLWGRSSTLYSEASGDTVSLVATVWDWQVGDYIFFLDQADPRNPVHAVRQITDIDGLELTLDDGLPQSFPAGGFVWPLIFGRLDVDDGTVTTSRYTAGRISIAERTSSVRPGESTPTTYLGRPVFTTGINWADGVSRSLSFDLRELSLGFGAEVFAPLQQHVVHGFKVGLQLRDEDAITEVDDFFSALHGRMLGFWLPAPYEALDAVNFLSTLQFDIRDQGLAAIWENHPAVYLWISCNGQNAAAKISDVADNGNGTERVTLTGALAFLPDATAMVFRLHYVRLVDDDERSTLQSEWSDRRELRVVELPTEYAAAEIGEEPVYLYHFWTDTTPVEHWRFTSFALPITSDGELFTASSITHGSLKRSIENQAEQVTITAFSAGDHPLRYGFPYPAPSRINVEILEAVYSAPDDTILLFTGEVDRAPRKGRQITATCVTKLDLEQKLPDALIGNRCSLQLFSTPCGVVRATFEKTGTISLISDRVIRVYHATAFDGLAAQHFTFGRIEVGSGAQTEVRSILKDTVVSATTRSLTLNLPLQHAAVNDAVTVLPGCDGKWTTCQDKFTNTRFLGHPFVPDENPTISAVPIVTSQGGKK